MQKCKMPVNVMLRMRVPAPHRGARRGQANLDPTHQPDLRQLPCAKFSWHWAPTQQQLNTNLVGIRR